MCYPNTLCTAKVTRNYIDFNKNNNQAFDNLTTYLFRLIKQPSTADGREPNGLKKKIEDSRHFYCEKSFSPPDRSTILQKITRKYVSRRCHDHHLKVSYIRLSFESVFNVRSSFKSVEHFVSRKASSNTLYESSELDARVYYRPIRDQRNSVILASLEMLPLGAP